MANGEFIATNDPPDPPEPTDWTDWLDKASSINFTWQTGVMVLLGAIACCAASCACRRCQREQRKAARDRRERYALAGAIAGRHGSHYHGRKVRPPTSRQFNTRPQPYPGPVRQPSTLGESGRFMHNDSIRNVDRSLSVRSVFSDRSSVLTGAGAAVPIIVNQESTAPSTPPQEACPECGLLLSDVVELVSHVEVQHGGRASRRQSTAAALVEAKTRADAMAERVAPPVSSRAARPGKQLPHTGVTRSGVSGRPGTSGTSGGSSGGDGRTRGGATRSRPPGTPPGVVVGGPVVVMSVPSSYSSQNPTVKAKPLHSSAIADSSTPYIGDRDANTLNPTGGSSSNPSRSSSYRSNSNSRSSSGNRSGVSSAPLNAGAGNSTDATTFSNNRVHAAGTSAGQEKHSATSISGGKGRMGPPHSRGIPDIHDAEKERMDGRILPSASEVRGGRGITPTRSSAAGTATAAGDRENRKGKNATSAAAGPQAAAATASRSASNLLANEGSSHGRPSTRLKDLRPSGQFNPDASGHGSRASGSSGGRSSRLDMQSGQGSRASGSNGGSRREGSSGGGNGNDRGGRSGPADVVAPSWSKPSLQKPQQQKPPSRHRSTTQEPGRPPAALVPIPILTGQNQSEAPHHRRQREGSGGGHHRQNSRGRSSHGRRLSRSNSLDSVTSRTSSLNQGSTRGSRSMARSGLGVDDDEQSPTEEDFGNEPRVLYPGVRRLRSSDDQVPIAERLTTDMLKRLGPTGVAYAVPAPVFSPVTPNFTTSVGVKPAYSPVDRARAQERDALEQPPKESKAKKFFRQLSS